MYRFNKLYGERHEYYECGTLKSFEFYFKGKKEGNCKYFYKNGVMRTFIPYKNNKIHGKVFSYHGNTCIDMMSFYSNNKLNGLSIQYFDTGVKMKRYYHYGKNKERIKSFIKQEI